MSEQRNTPNQGRITGLVSYPPDPHLPAGEAVTKHEQAIADTRDDIAEAFDAIDAYGGSVKRTSSQQTSMMCSPTMCATRRGEWIGTGSDGLSGGERKRAAASPRLTTALVACATRGESRRADRCSRWGKGSARFRPGPRGLGAKG